MDQRVKKPVKAAALPLAAVYVMLAIGPGDRHGYAIMSEIKRITKGSVQMGPGTLYGTIKRLLANGLIEERKHLQDVQRGNRRRRYYRLTALGRTAVATEVEGLQSLLQRSGARTWALGHDTS